MLVEIEPVCPFCLLSSIRCSIRFVESGTSLSGCAGGHVEQDL